MSYPELSGLFSNWDDATWDCPAQLMEAIKLWLPGFGSRLCEVLDEAGEVSVDEIQRAAEQRRHGWRAPTALPTQHPTLMAGRPIMRFRLRFAMISCASLANGPT